MKLENHDVIVVGGGLAGCIAAKAVADKGKKAAMVFPNGGKSELSSGCLDVFGVVPGEKPAIVYDYAEGIKQIAAKEEHPYHNAKNAVAKGIDAVAELAKIGGYELVGFEGKNVWIPNMMGTFTLVSYVPCSHEKAVFIKGESKNVLVVGFKGNVAFNAVAAAKSYKKYQKKLRLNNNYYSLNLALNGMTGRHRLSDSELADYLDTDEGIDDLSKKLKSFLECNSNSYDLVLLPPVLGFVRYRKRLRELREACGVDVAEVLTFGNAVVGYRMTRAIYKGLEREGITLLKGSRVEALSVEETVVLDCTIGLTDQLHSGEKMTLSAPAVVLATGGFVGGGIQARRREIWLNLLEENLGQVATDILNRNPVHGSGQEVLTLGASVNEDFSVKGDKFKGRVFACGDLLSGFNATAERSGAGVAVATGYLAGQNAARKAN